MIPHLKAPVTLLKFRLVPRFMNTMKTHGGGYDVCGGFSIVESLIFYPSFMETEREMYILTKINLEND